MNLKVGDRVRLNPCKEDLRGTIVFVNEASWGGSCSVLFDCGGRGVYCNTALIPLDGYEDFEERIKERLF